MKKYLLFCLTLFAAGTAGAQCPASLTAAQSPSGNNLLNVNFTNTSSYGLPFSGQMKSFNINYGDISGLNNYPGTSIPSHAYSAPGTYTVGFRIRSYDSATGTTICTDSTTISVTVAYPACGSTIAVSGTGAAKTFTANTPAGTTGMSYAWAFGDGGTGTGSPVTHTYASTGTYNVTLTATAGSGSTACTYTNTMAVFVYIPPPPLNCSALSANFSPSVSGNVASFTNSSSVASGSYQTIASWSFGDGTTFSGYTTSPHTYTATGVYSVKLVMQWKDSLNTTSCKDSITKIVSITSIPTPTNIISGNVIYDTTHGLSFFKVYLIKYDSATSWLYAVDSLITGNTAAPYYAFGNKPAGNYRTKAAPWTGLGFGTGYIPTYHDSSVYWNSAKIISHGGGSTLNKRIYVPYSSSVGSGAGFIGGNVSLGANKGAASGVSNMLIYLRDANMRVIQMAYTDANGDYSFSNLPYAPYSIWPEHMNYTTMPVTPIVLNAARPSWTGTDFNMDDSKRSIAPRAALSVTGMSVGQDFMTISPVPAHNNINISWSTASDAGSQFTITSITGEAVIRTPRFNGRTGSANLDVSRLANGVYFMHGAGSLAGQVVRLVIQ
jgi:PKD repeat protein